MLTHLRSQFRHSRIQVGSRRRGAVIPLIAVCAFLILGVAALTIDSGRLYVARGELQNAADSAALAAATAILSEANQKGNTAEVTQKGYGIASLLSKKHHCYGKSISLLESNVTFGRLENSTNLSEPFNAGATTFNAVQVNARRATDSNGALDLTFAKIWGLNKTNVSATAVAIVDDHMSGYKPPASGVGPMIPISLSAEKFDEQAAIGPDEYGFDPETGEVTLGADGIPEVNIYPGDDGKKGKEVPGNFGLLNIGVSSNSEGGVETQIENGVTQQNLTDEVGSSELSFYDDSGTPLSYQIDGTTGLKTSLQSSLDTRVGDIVGVPVNSGVTGTGNSSMYTIVGLRFCRMMFVELSGNNKRVIVQPAFYSGSDVITSPEAPSTNLNASRIRLAR